MPEEIISNKRFPLVIFLALAMRIPPAFLYFSNRNLPEEILPEEIISKKEISSGYISCVSNAHFSCILIFFK